MALRRNLVLGMLWGGLVGGCGGSSTSDGGVCIPGETQECRGSGNCEGAQACLKDGSGWGECDCGSGSAAAGGSGSRGTGGSSNEGVGGETGSSGGSAVAGAGAAIDTGGGGAGGNAAGVGGTAGSGIIVDGPDIVRLAFDELGTSCADIPASFWARTDADGNRVELITATPCSNFLSGEVLAPGEHFVIEGNYEGTSAIDLTLRAFDSTGTLLALLVLEDYTLERLMFGRSRENPATIFYYDGETLHAREVLFDPLA